MKSIVVILDSLRSVHNVGSIFRTADAVGVSKIILCGSTPTPIDRFGREVQAFSKVSLGAEKTIPWQYIETTEEAVRGYKKLGYYICALEQHPRSVPYNAKISKNTIALVVGREVEGLSETILSEVDTILEIPMRGTKESLNVSVATGIALYELVK